MALLFHNFHQSRRRYLLPKFYAARPYPVPNAFLRSHE